MLLLWLGMAADTTDGGTGIVLLLWGPLLLLTMGIELFRGGGAGLLLPLLPLLLLLLGTLPPGLISC